MRSGIAATAAVATLLLASACGGGAGEKDGEQATAEKGGDRPAAELRLPAGLASPAPAVPHGAALWADPAEPARSLLVGAAGPAGIVLLGLDGRQRGAFAGLDADLLALAGAGTALDGSVRALVVAHDRSTARLRLLALDSARATLRAIEAGEPPAVGAEATGLCLYRNPSTGRLSVFVVTGDGHVQQWSLFPRGERVAARRVRSVALGVGAAGCTVDEARGALYVADESVGIWRLDAEAESDPERRLIDRVAPHGGLGEEVAAVAVHAGVLLALGDQGERIDVYALPEGRHLGQLTPRAAEPSAAPGELESLWAGPGAGGGALVLADPDSSAGARWRVLGWEAVLRALALPAAPPGPGNAPTTRSVVEPAVETDPVDDYGDAADDPAIWVHPNDPARSLIVTAQKKRGIQVFDLAGRSRQLLADGRVNNVDLRQGLRIGALRLDLVVATNRTSRTLGLYSIDASGRLRDVAAEPVPTGFRDPYGVCLYVSARDGAAYVFANDAEDGRYRQWRLEARGSRVAAVPVREFGVGSQAEGCVADDETGALYVAEEDVGLWRYGAEPDAGEQRRPIDGTAEGGRLRADVEGLAIYRGERGAGFLVVSNQGADDYAVYRREGDNAFVGRFAIIANEAQGIDGASETDGLDVTSQPLGPAFPHGLLVVQDGRNLAPEERQNFKLVPWERVAAALGLRDL